VGTSGNYKMQHSTTFLFSFLLFLCLHSLQSVQCSSDLWKEIGYPSADREIRLFIALREENIEKLEDMALEISNPKNEHYGQHISLKELNELISPQKEEVLDLLRWLKHQGIQSEWLPATGWIKITSNVKNMEKLLQCSFSMWENVMTTGETILRCSDSYVLPAEFGGLIEFIAPVHGFPRTTPALRKMKMKEKHITKRQDNYTNITPDEINGRYNMTLTNTSFGVNNTQAVWENQASYNPNDTLLFFQTFLPKLVGQTIVKTLGDIPNNPAGEADEEASLDVQYIMGIGAFAPSYSYNYGEMDVFAAFLHWVTDLASDPRPPLVHSVSYGQYGGDYNVTIVDRISNEWMKLGTRGVTVLFASGDDGVGCNGNCTYFEFPYPSSPWITLVGATRMDLLTSNPNVYTEVGSTFSSGGFSNDFAMPKWQQAQVQWYLDNCPNVPTTFFNASGRALPDVAAVGENILIYDDGSQVPATGTSASSPIFAGFISLWNGIRLKAKKQPLGFINPLLYSAFAENPDTFFDVTDGNNADGCCPGFSCFKGWDPVTGLGTPNFRELLKVIEKLK